MAADRLEPPPSRSEWAVLGVLAEGPAHGFALARLLDPDGELGQIWSLPRPVVYRSLRRLEARHLIVAHAVRSGDRGPDRTVMAVTAAGRRQVQHWLQTPVDHVRDMRSELLLKLVLLHRAGADPHGLLEVQQAALLPRLEGLERRHRAATGSDRLVAGWRLSAMRAAMAFLAREAGTANGEDPASGDPVPSQPESRRTGDDQPAQPRGAVRP